MKQFFRLLTGIFCAFFLLIPMLCGTAEAQEISVSAQSAVLISADTSAVLFEKNAGQRLSMASTTKIMTALLALEEAERSGDSVVSITAEMVAVEGSSMGLQAHRGALHCHHFRSDRNDGVPRTLCFFQCQKRRHDLRGACHGQLLPGVLFIQNSRSIRRNQHSTLGRDRNFLRLCHSAK